jgi:hypothetical protein
MLKRIIVCGKIGTKISKHDFLHFPMKTENIRGTDEKWSATATMGDEIFTNCMWCEK